MKNQKPKTVNYPTNQEDAQNLIFRLSEDLRIKSLLMTKQDFRDHCEVEGWTEDDLDHALDIAWDEICESFCYAINNAFEEVENKKRFKSKNNEPKK